MFQVQVTPRRSYWVELTPDNGTNVGGFYCEVFEDKTRDSKRVLDFTIGKNQLSIKGHLGKAFLYAKDRVIRELK